MRFIELTKVAQVRHGGGDDFTDTDDMGEPQQAREGAPEAAPASNKVMVGVESIRCFYPRKNNAPGTRITFLDGGGFPVDEDYATVKGLVQSN